MARLHPHLRIQLKSGTVLVDGPVDEVLADRHLWTWRKDFRRSSVVCEDIEECQVSFRALLPQVDPEEGMGWN